MTLHDSNSSDADKTDQNRQRLINTKITFFLSNWFRARVYLFPTVLHADSFSLPVPSRNVPSTQCLPSSSSLHFRMNTMCLGLIPQLFIQRQTGFFPSHYVNFKRTYLSLGKLREEGCIITPAIPATASTPPQSCTRNFCL